MEMGEEWVVVRIESGYLRASVLKAKLEAAGIPVSLRYESAGPVLGITVNGLGEVRILVPRSLASEAEEVLKETQLPEGGEN